MIQAMENDYNIIRIFQPDVWLDKNKWEKYLLKSIKYLKKADNISYVFIDMENRYEKHIEDLENYYNEPKKYKKSLNTFANWLKIRDNLEL